MDLCSGELIQCFVEEVAGVPWKGMTVVMGSLTGKIALVTGASAALESHRGRLAQGGAAVAVNICECRKARAVAESIVDNGERPGDAGRHDRVAESQRLVQDTVKQFHHLDIPSTMPAGFYQNRWKTRRSGLRRHYALNAKGPYLLQERLEFSAMEAGSSISPRSHHLIFPVQRRTWEAGGAGTVW